MFCLVYRHKRTSCLAAATLLLLILGLSLETRDRQKDVLPMPAVMASARPASMQSCAACHAEQVSEFQNAPHRLTLRTAQEIDAQKLFGNQSITLGAVESTWRFDETDRSLWVNSTAYPSPIQIDWLFGSGSHAITPVSLHPDSDGRMGLIEHHVSWYPEAGLAATLGITDSHHPVAGIKAVGECRQHPEAIECFGCHTTHLPVIDGQLQQTEIMPGVQCARCHIRTNQHIASMENGNGETFMDDWKQLTALEAINRCGECHRRADQMTADELVSTNPLLVRFAPVGLSQSACFQGRDTVQEALGVNTKFNCTFCHDPHQPASSEVGFYENRCLKCHGSQPGQANVCLSQPMTSQCLSCHMPPVEVQSHLSFTDHWIRVRTP